MADNGIVAARAKSVTAKWNISMFRGVRTWKKSKFHLINTDYLKKLKSQSQDLLRASMADNGIVRAQSR
jgi:hypothetical protein